MSEKIIYVTQIRSSIGRSPRQGKTLRGLGLGKMHRTVQLPDNQATWGMIRKVDQLVQIQNK